MSTLSAAPRASETQLLQLNTIMQLCGEAADIARVEIAHPPESIGVGAPGTWTRITGALARMEAAIVIYERLGGPALPASARAFAIEARHLPTRTKAIVGEAEAVLATLTQFAENLTLID